MPEARLDVALAERGLARSRTHAASLIADGLVTVDGVAVVRPSAKVGDEQVLVVAASDHYVSRGAHKLIAALDAFDVPVQDRVAMDVGASTGGFSQVLLERGARQVIALDVGHGQLAPVLAGSLALVCTRLLSWPTSRSSRSPRCCRPSFPPQTTAPISSSWSNRSSKSGVRASKRASCAAQD
jgi:hypothetical protein